MAHFGLCTTDPFSATTCRSAPVSSYQMARAQEAIMRSPPCASRTLSASAPTLTVASFQGWEFSRAPPTKKSPLWGTWHNGQTMSAHYSAHNERLSFGIQYKVIRASKPAAKANGDIQSLETAWK